MPMSSEGGGRSNLFSAYKVSTADFEDFLCFLKLVTFGLFINDLSSQIEAFCVLQWTGFLVAFFLENLNCFVLIRVRI